MLCVYTYYKRVLPFVFQSVLKQLELYLRDPVWNDLEHAYYHQTSGRVLHTLHSFLAFPPKRNPLTPSSDKAVLVARRICSLSLSQSFLDLVLELAKGKVRVYKLQVCSFHPFTFTCTLDLVT